MRRARSCGNHGVGAHAIPGERRRPFAREAEHARLERDIARRVGLDAWMAGNADDRAPNAAQMRQAVLRHQVITGQAARDRSKERIRAFRPGFISGTVYQAVDPAEPCCDALDRRFACYGIAKVEDLGGRSGSRQEFLRRSLGIENERYRPSPASAATTDAPIPCAPPTTRTTLLSSSRFIRGGVRSQVGRAKDAQRVSKDESDISEM